MRKYRRLPLEAKERTYLSRRKQACAALKPGEPEIEKKWKSARQTLRVQSILSALRKMTGARERCMYCVDSHACDIEHFWPKSSYPGRMFLWDNMLLCCTECGRFKGNRFPLENNKPLLIDPTVEDPWAYIEFDPETGNLSPRFDAARQQYSGKGNTTVELLQLDRRESLAAGYVKTWKRLSKAVDAFLQGSRTEPAFLKEILEEDDHGLLAWCLGSSGIQESPFQQLHATNPGVCDRIKTQLP